MSDLHQTLQELPLAGLLPVGLLVVIGLLLWAAGQKLLRTCFAIVGFLVGGIVGWLLAQALPWGVPGWLGAVIGAIGLAILSAAAFKLAVMWTFAAVLAVFAPTGVLTVHELQAKQGDTSLEKAGDKTGEWIDKHFDQESREKTGQAISDATAKLKEQIDAAGDAIGEKIDERGGEAAHKSIEEIRQFGERLVESLRKKWDEAPKSLRPILSIAAIVGSLLGLILGFIAPKFSAAAVTSLGGSLLWLTGLRLIAVRVGVPEGAWMPASGGAWMAVWLITTLLGVGIQWTKGRRKADKSPE